MTKFILLLVIMLILSAPVVGAVSVIDSRSELIDAFAALSKAESAGGDVRELMLKLNSAAALIDKGGESNLAAADQIIRDVAGQAQGVEVAGAQRIQFRYIATGAALVILAVSGGFIWFRGSRLFWVAWLRVKRGWRVERI